MNGSAQSQIGEASGSIASTNSSAQAHEELKDLFREICLHGHVTAREMQENLLPFTAGAARQDIEEIITEMKRKQSCLDEEEFVRMLWRKIYLVNAPPPDPQLQQQHQNQPRVSTSTSEALPLQQRHWNVPLSHVIVSIKRRSQIKQFAQYYTSRGISGADNLTFDTRKSHSTKLHKAAATTHGKLMDSNNNAHTHHRPSSKHQQQHEHQQQPVQQQVETQEPQTKETQTIESLRRRKLGIHDLEAFIFNGKTRELESQTVLSGLKGSYLLSYKSFVLLLDREQEQTNGCLLLAARAYFPERLVKSSSFYDDLMVRKDLEDFGLKGPLYHFSVAARGTRLVTSSSNQLRRIYEWQVTDMDEPDDNYGIPDTSGDNNDETKDEDLSGPKDPFIALWEGSHKLSSRPIKCHEFEASVRDVDATWRQSGVLTNVGELFVWNNGSIQVPNKPLKFPSGKILRVACGSDHTLALTSTCQVFAWGYNLYGQLGLNDGGEQLFCNEPMCVCANKDFLDVAAGDDHSVLLDKEGRVHAFGNNWHGQLAQDPQEIESLAVPTQVANIPTRDRVYWICAVANSTAVVTDKDQVFVWGKCIPSGLASVCGIVSRFVPQLVSCKSPSHPEECLDEPSSSSTKTTGGAGGQIAQLAIADGLVVLLRHAQQPQQQQQDTG